MTFKNPLLFLLFITCFSVQATNFGASQQKKKSNDSTEYYTLKLNKSQSKDDYIAAFAFFRRIKDENLKASKFPQAIYNLRQIAIIQNKLGFYYDSEESAIEALKLVDVLPENDFSKECRIGIYNHLGIIYRNLLDFEKALDYYQKASDLVTDFSHQITLKTNIGFALIKSDQLNEALAVYEALFQEIPKISKQEDVARILHNFGMVKGKLNHPDAEDYFTQALEIREALNRTTDIIGSYLDMSDYYIFKGETETAKRYAQKAYNLAVANKSAHIMAEALGHVMVLKEDPEVVAYKELRDSIKNGNLLEEGKYAAKKYDLDGQEKIANDNLLQAEKEKNLKLIYGYTAILLLFIGLVWYFIIRHRHKKQKQLEVYNTELRISKKVHDEVANDVYHLMNKLQQTTIDKNAILDDLEDVYEKTRNISREYNDIDVDTHYSETLADFISNYQSEDTNIIIKGLSKINWDGFSKIDKVAIYRVLQELMTNMKKHSLATFVVLDFVQDGKKIAIHYKDNGVGCEIKKQNGLQNAENRIKTINGSITFKSEINEGFSALMQI